LIEGVFITMMTERERRGDIERWVRDVEAAGGADAGVGVVTALALINGIANVVHGNVVLDGECLCIIEKMLKEQQRGVGTLEDLCGSGSVNGFLIYVGNMGMPSPYVAWSALAASA
jgi:hypothetical protein